MSLTDRTVDPRLRLPPILFLMTAQEKNLARLTVPIRNSVLPEFVSSIPGLLNVAVRLAVSAAIALFIMLAVYNTLAGPPPTPSGSGPGLPGAYHQVEQPLETHV